MKSRLTQILLALTLTLTLGSGCGIYSFSSGKLKEGIKTVTVELFENKAPLIKPAPNNPPMPVVLGIKINMAATSSITPIPILP